MEMQATVQGGEQAARRGGTLEVRGLWGAGSVASRRAVRSQGRSARVEHVSLLGHS